jgi:PPM family protein phosphatase
MKHTALFQYGFRDFALVDTGKCRNTNQDEVISCPELGFFAVCDGMGGLSNGGDTSHMIATILPKLIEQAAADLANKPDSALAGDRLDEYIQMVSNNIYNTAYKGKINFGATLSCIWLVDEYAVFANLGDSRGYLLPKYKKTLRQITQDHNVAAIMVAQGELTKEEARSHPASSRLTRFVGMPSPAIPEIFIEKVTPGDRLLLCSDGLHGMVQDINIRKILRSSRSPQTVCKRLIEAANENGGKDNISAAYIQITY